LEQIKNYKGFFEVFPTLKVNEKINLLFQEVQISQISTNQSRDFLHVHIFSTHLIDKQTVHQMEQKIKEQLFAYQGIEIKIKEKYQLSKQFDLKHLVYAYRESILFELRCLSVLTSNIFSAAKLRYEENDVLVLELEDSIISRSKEKDIQNLLQDIFVQRFQMAVQVQFVYVTRKEKKAHEENAAQPEQIHKTTHEAIHEVIIQKPQVKKRNSSAKGSFKSKSPRQGSDPNLFYGRNFDDAAIPLEQVVSEMGIITVRGQILKLETKEIRNERTIIIFRITDFTDSIVIKMFIYNAQLPEVLAELKQDAFVKIKGVTIIDNYDSELQLASIHGIKTIPDFRKKRQDLASKKRVELHCHSKMSDMDGVAEVKALIQRAHEWGHPAIAITDHGVVQAFPDANNFLRSLKKDDPFKVIYGVEGYVVDDLTEIAVSATDQTLDDTYVVFDIETTGFSPIKDKIIEIGALKIVNGEIVDSFSTYVNPKRPIPYEITKLTGISDEMVLEADGIETVLPRFLEFVKESVLVAHNAGFDVRFIEQNCRYQDIVPDFISVDTVALARVLLPTLSRFKLNTVAKALHIPLLNHHRAVDDAKATAEIFLKFVEMLKDRGISTLKGMNQFGAMNPHGIRKMPSHHIIILAKNDIGKLNLYQLISKSHVTYFGRVPRIPKSELVKHREGLIVGSACENGELYQAILQESPVEEIARLADFYDYYEIQPLGNNQFMIEEDRYSEIHSQDDLIAVNKKIVALGEQFKKPVVATCDVHFLEPEDAIYRSIIMAGKGFSDADRQPPLYLRTTEEMLEEFLYLGSAKAQEVVIDNPQKIADCIEKISPISQEKCVPSIENSDAELREICYKRAYEIYGINLPQIVKERLERELNSIISNGYAVMYIIAQKLVWESNDKGYLVGSRGSVGSSFAATMAGITEVNPLSPHYYCVKCHYSDFESPEVRRFAGGCGFDMPDKVCPDCKAVLQKAGFDIPFETFLGFEGDKEPDIDLNFSGDYQAKAHQHTERLFGKGYTFKAGTIGTLADKTAYGFVKKYYDERSIRKRNCEIDRLVSHCTGVRRSTGQHPGGIIVLPHGYDINEFTPIQRPANDNESEIITTHFDYHSIDHNLLKLDILGHDDPTIIRTLEEYISSDALDNEFHEKNPFDATTIPLDDKDVLSLFHSTDALGIKPVDIDGCRLGCLGVPEFGTGFVIKMVEDAKPQSLSDLIRISGLSHGTDVWLNNAQEIIQSGQATLSTCICTRDDIMVYLIHQGMDSALAFTIMESVRKGKGLKLEWEVAMKTHDVPDWYIWSCKQIKYMFPKAHAAAYVMMAYRIAYCKIHYPLAYYAAYFGIRAKAFSYKIMCQGKEKLDYFYKDYKKRDGLKQLTKVEEETLKDMRVVQEMYARGLEFTPVDIYRAKAKRFLIIDGKLMPSLSKIEGLGDKAADVVELAAKDGKYLSIDDFRQRTKVSKTTIELMEELGLFGDLPKSNQLSLFDL